MSQVRVYSNKNSIRHSYVICKLHRLAIISKMTLRDLRVCRVRSSNKELRASGSVALLVRPLLLELLDSLSLPPRRAASPRQADTQPRESVSERKLTRLPTSSFSSMAARAAFERPSTKSGAAPQGSAQDILGVQRFAARFAFFRSFARSSAAACLSLAASPRRPWPRIFSSQTVYKHVMTWRSFFCGLDSYG